MLGLDPVPSSGAVCVCSICGYMSVRVWCGVVLGNILSGWYGVYLKADVDSSFDRNVVHCVFVLYQYWADFSITP